MAFAADGAIAGVHTARDDISDLTDAVLRMRDVLASVSSVTAQNDTVVNEKKSLMKLNTRRQAPNETFPNYVEKMIVLVDNVHNLTPHERKDLLIKRLVEGTAIKELKERLQQSKALTTTTAIEIAREMNLDGAPQPPGGKKGAEISSDECQNCGFKHLGLTCPGLKTICTKCNIKGHFARKCNQKPVRPSCIFCGGPTHPRNLCPANYIMCSKCHGHGHFPKMCQNARIGSLPSLLSKAVPKPIVGECRFCKNGNHTRVNCPARNHVCSNCKEIGHYVFCCGFKRKSSAATRRPPTVVEFSDGSDDDNDKDLDDRWIIEDIRQAVLYGKMDQYGLTLEAVAADVELPCKLFISEITDKSQAQREKLRVGDFILKIDDIDAMHMTLPNALYVLQFGKPPHSLVVCSMVTPNPEHRAANEGDSTSSEYDRPVAPLRKTAKKNGAQHAVHAKEEDPFLELVRDFYYTLPMQLRADAAAEILDVLERFQAKSQEAAKPVPNIETYLQLLELENLAVVPNQDEFECQICLTPYESGDGFILKNCLHVFCKQCLQQMVETSEVADIKCPNEEGCDTVLTQKEIKALVPDDVFQKYLEKCLSLAEHQDTGSYHCTTPDCRYWSIIEDGVDNFRCPACMRVNCLSCKTSHDGLTCETYKKLGAENMGDNPKTLEMIGAMLETHQAMRCPKCQVVVMKVDGCDAVVCSCCKSALCWATKGLRWGPAGLGDSSGGCGCRSTRLSGALCHPQCQNCH